MKEALYSMLLYEENDYDMDKENKNRSRPKFVGILCVVFFVAIAIYSLMPNMREHSQQITQSTWGIAGDYLSMEETEAFAIRQVITKESATSRTIMWQSELEENDAIVEYKIKNLSEIKSVVVSNKKFTDDGITLYLHTANLENLEPHVQYEYRIGDGNKRSNWYTLNTDTGGDFKALIFPDSQSNDYSGWKRLVQVARKENPDAEFFVNMGDLVDNGEDYSQWQAWFNAVSGMVETIPVAPVLGNHETYNRDWKVRMPESYLNLFSLPENGDAMRQNQFYSFDYGAVHFIVLNTQIDEMEQFQPGLLETQQKWFVNDIKNTNKKWKVVLMHKDVLTYEIKNRTDRKAGISDIGRAWMPLFDEYGVDAVLTAHLHTYRRRGNLYDFESDTRGPLYIITGVAGNVRYPDLWVDHPFDQATAPQPETDNYMTIEASEDVLRLAAFLVDGRKIDQVEIRK